MYLPCKAIFNGQVNSSQLVPHELMFHFSFFTHTKNNNKNNHNDNDVENHFVC